MASIELYNERYEVLINNRYKHNNQPVIEIADKLGMPSGVISVCIPNHNFEENETAISSDVDQEEVAKQLSDQGVIKITGKTARSGYGQYPVVEVLGEIG